MLLEDRRFPLSSSFLLTIRYEFPQDPVFLSIRVFFPAFASTCALPFQEMRGLQKAYRM